MSKNKTEVKLYKLDDNNNWIEVVVNQVNNVSKLVNINKAFSHPFIDVINRYKWMNKMSLGINLDTLYNYNKLGTYTSKFKSALNGLTVDFRKINAIYKQLEVVDNYESFEDLEIEYEDVTKEYHFEKQEVINQLKFENEILKESISAKDEEVLNQRKQINSLLEIINNQQIVINNQQNEIPKLKQSKIRMVAFNHNLEDRDIQIIYEMTIEIFDSNLEQWKNLFSKEPTNNIGIKLRRDVGHRAVTDLFIGLNKEERIFNKQWVSILHKLEAFRDQYNNPLISDQLHKAKESKPLPNSLKYDSKTPKWYLTRIEEVLVELG